MKRSSFLLNTLKETPKEAVVTSHILMLRTCMIKQLTSGIYSYLPLALRSLRKIENIIREELDAVGCQELLMPVVQPADLWVESGRWRDYGKELLRFKDRKGNDYCLGPTHEEVVTDIVRREVRSYKDLPCNFYQIQTKFRDEIRPRFGLMRGREFLMKDAYSFDVDDRHADRSYWLMYEAYKRIFQRCGLDFRPVEADPGAIGGNFTHEFHVLAGSGEDLIFSCDNCDYAANAERCELVAGKASSMGGTPDDPVAVATPSRKTIEAVASFLKVEPEACIKSLLYRTDEDQLAVALIPGDRELNETAFKNALGAVELEMVTRYEVFAEHGLFPGFLGPVGLPGGVRVLADTGVMSMATCVTGANKKDYHLTGVVPGHHFRPDQTLILRAPRAGDSCPRCDQGTFATYRGIEVGQVFKLGTKYSVSMKASYLDTEGKERPMVMGCYGIGVSRTMSAAIEQSHDAGGIIWPVPIAPFHVMLLNLDIGDEATVQAVDALYPGLRSKGVEVLLDDTAQRPGPKFKDADLIGFPLQLRVGARSLKNGTVDLKARATGEKWSVPLGTAVEDTVAALVKLGWCATSGRV